MEFISIKLKKNFVDYLKILFLTLFSFFICYHYGFNGIVPLDDFVSYNCGYRILSGDEFENSSGKASLPSTTFSKYKENVFMLQLMLDFGG